MWREEELLILTKTYPNPSQKYRETTCVAALTRSGELRRIFPVPFRLLEGSSQFKRWEWVRARIIKARDDHRPESYKVDIDSIVRTGEVVTPAKDWANRLRFLQPHVHPTFASLEDRRISYGNTLGVLRVSNLLELSITPESVPNWSEEELTRLSQEGLFDSEEVRSRKILRKVPFRFHYRYQCEAPGIVEDNRHLILDWEVSALYWNCLKNYGPDWEPKFREKIEQDFRHKDLHLLMGTVHRFPDQWLIIGLVYPPKKPATPTLFEE